jgi:hypothetical protein
VGAGDPLFVDAGPAAALPPNPAEKPEIGARSELGGRHCRLHAASTAVLLVGGALPPAARPPPAVRPTCVAHAQFHVAGQSVSTLHAPVGCATHVLHVIEEHVLASVGFRLMLGGTTGGRALAQGTLVAMPYGGTLACDGGASS